MNIKTIKLFAVIGCFSIVLSGCTTFGVDNDTWKQLTPNQRKIAMQNYYQAQAQQQAQQAQIDKINAQKQAEIDKINAQNAPLNNAVAAINSLAAAKENEHKKCITDDFGNTVCGYNCSVDQFGTGHCGNS